MPQSSRPRIIPESTATQPQQQVDPMELVRQLLAPAPSPIVQELGTMDKIGSLLNAVASGVAVGTSADPGRALQGQLQQQQQMKFQADQAQKERDERLQNLNRQFGLQVLGGQIQEQQQIRSEDRAEKRSETSRKNAMDDYIKKNQIEFDFGTKRDNQRAQLEKADAILKHGWDVEKQDNQEYQFWYQQNRLENKELFDKKISLITAGIPAGKANDIANKMFQGEDLTPSEEKVITAAAQKQMKLAARAAGGGRSGSGAGLSDKQQASYFAARMKDQFLVIDVPVLDSATGQPIVDPSTKQPVKQEQIVEMANAPKDPVTGKIIGMKRVASQGEKMKILADEADGLQALMNPGVRQQLRTGANPVEKNVMGGGNSVKINHYKQQANQYLSQGMSSDEVAAGLQELKQSVPADAQAIDAVITTLPKSKTKVTPIPSAGKKGGDIRKQAKTQIFQ